MSEYISREALIEMVNGSERPENERIDIGYNEALNDIKQRLVEMPAADVKPVKYSSWEDHTYPIVDRDGVARSCMIGYVCKACGHGEPEEKRFCGGCGADMRGDDNG